MSLEQSWYLFPIFIPVVLIVGEYLSRFSWKFSRVILVFLLFFSLYMSYEYRGYFDVESKAEFKEYISGIDGKQIFTDHHTKYGVDLIRGYRDYQNVKLLDKLTTHANQGDIVIISKKKLDELKLQGFDYEFENFNNSPEKYKFGEFEVFELTN